MPTEKTEASQDGKKLLDATRPFAEESRIKSWWCPGSTLVILGTVLVLAAVLPWWPLRLAASITGGLVLVRAFIIYHDYMHGSLLFLLASRYCEVDSELKDMAGSLFNSTPPGWPRVQSICNFVYQHIRFDYQQARASRTALEAFRERTGVCRNYTHLAITLCRCMNIPGRYCTGYPGDIGVPPSSDPMDFSAWFEAYLGGRWYAFDPRNNVPRIGRVLMAHGRDAADAALTTTFGVNQLESFKVWTNEVSG